MAFRTFTTTLTVFVNDSESDHSDGNSGPATLDCIKTYLTNAMQIVWNPEDAGNPCGVASMEIDFENLVEVPPSLEVQRENARMAAVEKFGWLVVDEAEGYYQTDYAKEFWRDLNEEERNHYFFKAKSYLENNNGI